MKLAILYTSHRQFKELEYLPIFFRNLPGLRSAADIIYHNNNSDFSRDAIAEKLSKVPWKSMELIYAPQQNNGKYPYGQFEAICGTWEKLAGRFDWVIHLHPDVFIVDEKPLLALLSRAQAENADIIVTPIFGLKHPSCATDFFAFRPSTVPKTVFESYRSLSETDIVVPLENLFFIEIQRAHLKYLVANRFAHGQYHRDIDQLGLWHEHNLIRVDLYLKAAWARWPVTCARCLLRPYMAARFILNWCRRKLKGVTQDSLMQQLTAL